MALVTMISAAFSPVYGLICLFFGSAAGYTPVDIQLDEKAKQLHRIDSFNILAYTFLLILVVCTIWLLKKRRSRFLHETGLAIIYGLIIGAIIKYVGESDESSGHLDVEPILPNHTVLDAPPDALWVPLQIPDKSTKLHNKTYVYVFRGQLADSVRGPSDRDISQKATFDPEIFFNIILPPIIFNAGYSLKKRFFFRNIGAIMTYAFVGTTVSAVVAGVILFAFVSLTPGSVFTFSDCLYFGAITSATDPVSVLGIFHELHVDVNLYALVFGESILNDAVAITIAGAIDTFEQRSSSGTQMEAIGEAMIDVVTIFVGSLALGSFVGCSTALLTKFTRLLDYPILETCLFVLMSYSTFLMAEVLSFSGIVAVLFCGICQAHYTANNLSDESKTRTKQLFELLNFMAENFIFTYIGVSMFTYPTHKWKFSFILIAFVATVVGRAANIYPLSFLLNLGRNNKISKNFQHVLVFSGMRGAMTFSLALRNTVSEARQIMLTAVSVLCVVTIVFFGGSTSSLLEVLNIPLGVDDSEHEVLAPSSDPDHSPGSGSPRPSQFERSGLLLWWQHFDVNFMKPLLTNSRPTLIDTMPDCCLPIAMVLTTTEQLNEDGRRLSRLCARGEGEDYDSDDDGLMNNQIDAPFAQSTNTHATTYNGTGHSTRRSQVRSSQEAIDSSGVGRVRSNSSRLTIDSQPSPITFSDEPQRF